MTAQVHAEVKGSSPDWLRGWPGKLPWQIIFPIIASEVSLVETSDVPWSVKNVGMRPHFILPPGRSVQTVGMRPHLRLTPDRYVQNVGMRPHLRLTPGRISPVPTKSRAWPGFYPGVSRARLGPAEGFVAFVFTKTGSGYLLWAPRLHIKAPPRVGGQAGNMEQDSATWREYRTATWTWAEYGHVAFQECSHF
uniref:Uncharacterized protein n=1 Tax=Branchiostoma floridae TaxID=7739 RepID=C3YP76_BRAFL|eukprot:XP_002601955.1 hypothetical protein BRAFLDRAFT_86439 [Branchiostoma floridae]